MDIYKIALEKISSKTLLKDVALNASEFMVREEAVCWLTDQNVLSQIAANDNEFSVQIAASLRLNDVSKKTENLLRLLRKEIPDKDKIVKGLMELYSSQSLTPGDKAKILQANGLEIKKHSDAMVYHDSSYCGGDNGESHTDQAPKYFTL